LSEHEADRAADQEKRALLEAGEQFASVGSWEWTPSQSKLVWSDNGYGQPSLARHKIRRLELAAGAPSRKGHVRPGHGTRNPAIRQAERDLALRAETAYRRTIADWQATRPAQADAGVTPGRASERPSKGKAARQATSP
jgi:hypothetical protein